MDNHYHATGTPKSSHPRGAKPANPITRGGPPRAKTVALAIKVDDSLHITAAFIKSFTQRIEAAGWATNRHCDGRARLVPLPSVNR
jgi:hypothetical protein